MSQIKVVVEQRSRRRWAAVGFLLVVALTIIAWFAAPGVISWMRSTFRQFSTVGLTPLQLQLAFTAIVFVILLALTAIIVTLASPKKTLNVKDTDLVKEREQAAKYRRMQKKRQRTMNREMREYVEKNQRK